MLDLPAVRATMLVATVLWSCAEVLKIARPDRVEPARQLWTASLALALLHAALGFEVAYGWSHTAAAADAARRTAAVTGLDWGGGMAVNYVFLTLWLGDAIWWWADAAGYARRPIALERARLALFLFMFVNGTIVFAGNLARAIAVPATGAVCAAWVLGPRRDTVGG